MRPGLINAAVLAVLLGGIFAFNYVVDPFRLNRQFAPELEREGVAYDLSNYSWKYPEFMHEPKPVVLLGDSRTRRLPAAAVEDELGRPTFNFAFGGGTAADVLAAFWFADEHAELEHVFLGLGALLMSDTVRVERGRPDRELLAQPLRYYFSPFVTSASVKVLLFNHSGLKLSGEEPPMDREAFWRFQIEERSKQYFGTYAYPERLLEDLAQVGEHCRKEGIELTFFLPPSHTDFQETRREHGVEEEYRRSVAALRELGPVLDFDCANEVTRDAKNFGDPVHTTDEVAVRVARELAGGPRGLACQE